MLKQLISGAIPDLLLVEFLLNLVAGLRLRLLRRALLRMYGELLFGVAGLIFLRIDLGQLRCGLSNRIRFEHLRHRSLRRRLHLGLLLFGDEPEPARGESLILGVICAEGGLLRRARGRLFLLIRGGLGLGFGASCLLRVEILNHLSCFRNDF